MGKSKALLARASESLSWTSFSFWLRLAACCIDIDHWDLGLWPAHGSAPWTFGNGAFFGVLAIEGFFDVGAAFTATLEAELDDACAGAEAEHGAIEGGGALEAVDWPEPAIDGPMQVALDASD